MSFDVDATGYEAVDNFGKQLTQKMPERFGTYLEKLADDVIDEARNILQNNKNINTGTLLASIRILSNIEGKQITIGTDIPYAVYVEYGRPEVKPVNAKFLHWKDKTTGKDVFAKRSGPVKPMPFLAPAVLAKAHGYPLVVVEKEKDFVRSLSV